MLRKFCEKGNLTNQKKMYKNIEFFFKFMPINDLQQLALINEIYRNNYSACVQLQESHIRIVMKAIKSIQEEAQEERVLDLRQYCTFFENILRCQKQDMRENYDKVLQVLGDGNNLAALFFMVPNQPDKKSNPRSFVSDPWNANQSLVGQK